MPTSKEIREKVQTITQAIQDKLKEMNPDLKIEREEMKGVLIIFYPKDHSENSRLVTTAMGRICIYHTLMYLEQLGYQEKQRSNPLAS